MYYHFRNLWLIKLINQLLSTLINTDPKKEKYGHKKDLTVNLKLYSIVFTYIHSFGEDQTT